MAEMLPDPPYDLPADPAALLQSMLPGRIIPTLVPRFNSLLSKITVKTREYVGAYPDGTPLVVPGVTLVPKLIASSVSPEEDMHEFYVFMRGGDPEAFLDFWMGPTVAEGLVQCSISRSCGATLDIFFTDIHVKEMFAGTDVGYFGFAIVIASGEMLRK